MLSDCVSRNRAETELFIVQAPEIQRKAKKVRDRMTQAVLLIDETIIAVESAPLDQVLDCSQCLSIVAALGVGIWLDRPSAPTLFNLSGLRYGKIILVLEADPDGEHVRSQVLTFFFRFMGPLLESGHIYIAQPPKFVLRLPGGDTQFAWTVAERDQIAGAIGRKNVSIRRCGRLGNMTSDSFEKTITAPVLRRLIPVRIGSSIAETLQLNEPNR